MTEPTTDQLYAINDALTALANEFGIGCHDGGCRDLFPEIVRTGLTLTRARCMIFYMAHTTTEECFACGAEVTEFDIVCVDRGDRECPPEFALICAECVDGADDARISRAEYAAEDAIGDDWS